MDRKDYLPRIIDNQVEEYLKTFGALCIEGPKWCGISSLLERGCVLPSV